MRMAPPFSTATSAGTVGNAVRIWSASQFPQALSWLRTTSSDASIRVLLRPITWSKNGTFSRIRAAHFSCTSRR